MPLPPTSFPNTEPFTVTEATSGITRLEFLLDQRIPYGLYSECTEAPHSFHGEYPGPTTVRNKIQHCL